MISIRFEHVKSNKFNTQPVTKLDLSFPSMKSSSKFKQMLSVFTVLLLTTAFVVLCTAVVLNHRFYLISQRSRSNLQIEYFQGQVWVAVDAPLEQRLERLSDIIEVERRKMMNSAITYKPIEIVEKLYLDRNTYLQSLAENVDSVVTVYLEMLTDLKSNSSSNDTLKQELQGAIMNPKNFLQSHYYLWQAEPLVCEWYMDAKYRQGNTILTLC
jgi:hypothetical protein